jgi:putative Holliday junction resolvase
VNRSRTIIAFDFGQVRIGVAVGQELIAVARPLTVLKNRRQQPDWNAISRLLAEWQADLLLVGIPRHADDSCSVLTAAALRFSRQLQGRYRLPVETIDERLSSWEADAYSGSSGRFLREAYNDALAATLILESWFNRTRAVAQTADR